VLFDIANEDVVDVLLGLLLRALGEQLGVVDFDSVNAALEDADISQRRPHNCLLLLQHVAGRNQIRTEGVALVFATPYQNDQTFGVLALVGMEEVDVSGDDAHVGVSELAARRMVRRPCRTAGLRLRVHHRQIVCRLLAPLLLHVGVQDALVHEEGALQVALFVLLERSNIDQDALRGLQPVHQILDRQQTQLDLGSVVEALELPPAAREELVVR